MHSYWELCLSTTSNNLFAYFLIGPNLEAYFLNSITSSWDNVLSKMTIMTYIIGHTTIPTINPKTSFGRIIEGIAIIKDATVTFVKNA